MKQGIQNHLGPIKPALLSLGLTWCALFAGCASLPKDEAEGKISRFDNIRGQRFLEILLIGGNVLTMDLKGAVYCTAGLNDPSGTGDSIPPALLAELDTKAVRREYHVLSALKDGPKLWTIDWAEVRAGPERDFDGVSARWFMRLEVTKEMRRKQSIAYKEITGTRDSKLGISQGSAAFILDDPAGNSWVMTSAREAVGYQNLANLEARLKTPPGWKFRTVILEKELILTPAAGWAKVTQDELGNTYDFAGDSYANYTP